MGSQTQQSVGTELPWPVRAALQALAEAGIPFDPVERERQYKVGEARDFTLRISSGNIMWQHDSGEPWGYRVSELIKAVRAGEAARAAAAPPLAPSQE